MDIFEGNDVSDELGLGNEQPTLDESELAFLTGILASHHGSSSVLVESNPWEVVKHGQEEQKQYFLLPPPPPPPPPKVGVGCSDVTYPFVSIGPGNFSNCPYMESPIRSPSNDSLSSNSSVASSECTETPASPDSNCSGSLMNKRIYYRRSWSREEDHKLVELVNKYGIQDWSVIAEQMPGKTGNQCSQRWHKALDPKIIKGKWTETEDELLVALVQTHGKKWKYIAGFIPGRTGKQCRDRYTSRLDPNLKTGKWTKEEVDIVLNAHDELGNKWAAIQKRLPHRSWYTIKWKIESIKNIKKSKK